MVKSYLPYDASEKKADMDGASVSNNKSAFPEEPMTPNASSKKIFRGVRRQLSSMKMMLGGSTASFIDLDGSYSTSDECSALNGAITYSINRGESSRKSFLLDVGGLALESADSSTDGSDSEAEFFEEEDAEKAGTKSLSKEQAQKAEVPQKKGYEQKSRVEEKNSKEGRSSSKSRSQSQLVAKKTSSGGKISQRRSESTAPFTKRRGSRSDRALEKKKSTRRLKQDINHNINSFSDSSEEHISEEPLRRTSDRGPQSLLQKQRSGRSDRNNDRSLPQRSRSERRVASNRLLRQPSTRKLKPNEDLKKLDTPERSLPVRSRSEHRQAVTGKSRKDRDHREKKGKGSFPHRTRSELGVDKKSAKRDNQRGDHPSYNRREERTKSLPSRAYSEHGTGRNLKMRRSSRNELGLQHDHDNASPVLARATSEHRPRLRRTSSRDLRMKANELLAADLPQPAFARTNSSGQYTRGLRPRNKIMWRETTKDTGLDEQVIALPSLLSRPKSNNSSREQELTLTTHASDLQHSSHRSGRQTSVKDKIKRKDPEHSTVSSVSVEKKMQLHRMIQPLEMAQIRF